MNDELVNESVGCDLSRQLMVQFIELYETLPELWNASCTAYMNRTKRNNALDKLLVIFKRIKPEAKREDVKKKINTLRSNFRKEQKKTISSKRSGAGADELYVPSAWTYFALRFLQNTEAPFTYYDDSEKDFGKADEQEDMLITSAECEAPSTTQRATHSRSSIVSTSAPPIHKKPRVVGPLARQNDLLQKACSYLELSTTPPKHIPPIVMAWSEKFESLQPQQKLFAEKAVNDILFEAIQGTLHRFSVKINENQPHLPSPCNHSPGSSNAAPFPGVSSPPCTFFQENFGISTHSPPEVVNENLKEYFVNFSK